MTPAARSLPGLARALRAGGVRLGTDAVLAAAQALAQVNLAHREEVRAALRATLLNDRGDFELFEQLFEALYPRQPGLPAGTRPALPRPEALQVAPGARRAAEALPFGAAAARARETRERDAQGTASADERLARKDFEQMSAAELERARQLLRSVPPRSALRRTRRFVSAARGSRPDLRRLLRAAARDFAPSGPWRRTPALRPRDWVLLVDVSGSMAVYARMFLHLAHALTRRSGRIETFLFATRLTRITRAMRAADPDTAVQAATALASDFDGGTRIGECLETFNLRWSRRVLARGAWVLLLTDGLERGDTALLARELERLARSARELIWINPLLRSPAYRPLAAGAAVLARSATRRVSAHDVHSLRELTRLIEAGAARAGSPDPVLDAPREMRP